MQGLRERSFAAGVLFDVALQLSAGAYKEVWIEAEVSDYKTKGGGTQKRRQRKPGYAASLTSSP